jgi:hypothetical protein
MDTLYSEATMLVRQFRDDDAYLKTISKEFYDALLEVAQAHAPTEQMHARILAAAKNGADQIELVRFLGSEVHDPSGFALLSLTKGSKTGQFNALMRDTYGTTSLLGILRKEYAPFQVVHTWNARTTLNRILIKWPVDRENRQSECHGRDCSDLADSE